VRLGVSKNIPAVHYTHATATFAASFLLRLARLLYALLVPLISVATDISHSPNECNATEIREQVETLASLMSKSENMLSEGLFSFLTNTFIVSSGQKVCLDSPIDA
jgi:hypothetical protein